MKMKRSLTLCLTLVICASLAIGGTMAYLQDTDSDVNVMTLGSVYIEQHEKDENGDDFQNQPLYPSVYEGNEPVSKDGYYASEDVVDKRVTVENTGRSEAYVRTIYAFEHDANKKIHINHNDATNTPWQWTDLGKMEIDGVAYDVAVAVYAEPLPAGETTEESLKQIYMDKTANNADVELFGDAYEVLVLSQAVQTAGFDGPEAALNEAFGEINAQNLSNWLQAEGSVPVASVSNAEELKEALEAGGVITLMADIELDDKWDPIGDKANGVFFTGTLDGNGHTISGLEVNGGDYAALIEAAKDATIKNLTVEGSVTAANAAGIVARVEGNTVIENCVSNVNVTGTTKAGGIACNVTNTNPATVIIKNCVNNGDVKGGDSGLGGIVGYTNGDATIHIIDCVNHGDIGNPGKYAGAAIGYASAPNNNTGSLGAAGFIDNFINTGKIANNAITDHRYLKADDGTVLINYCGTPANWGVKSDIVSVKAESDDKVANGNALGNAINSTTEDTTISVGPGEYKMPSINGEKEVAIIGSKDTVIDVTLGAYLEKSTVSFEGVTIKGSTGMANGNGSDYAALYTPNVTYTNCTFDGPFRVGRDGAKFINCTFTNLGNDYVWTYGNDTTFIGCTFESEGKALLIYSDGGNEVSEVVVEGCTFNATKGAKAGAIANQNCAAIEIHNYGNGVNLTTGGNTIDSDFSGEWRIKTYENGRPKVFVNGTEYTTIALDGKTMTIDSEKNVTVND